MPDDPTDADAFRRLLRTPIDSARRLETLRELPRDAADLDALIVNRFWPQAIRPLLANGLVPHIGADNAEPISAIRTVNSDEITRSLEFCIEDPDRPLTDHPIRTMWYCRFGLEVRATGYMLDKTTILSFPADFELETLARFLREPLMAGCTPNLSYNHPSAVSQPSYGITLQTGAGAGWGRQPSQDTAQEVEHAVRGHIPIIHAMDALARDWSSAAAFEELYRATVRANIAY